MDEFAVLPVFFVSFGNNLHIVVLYITTTPSGFH